MGKKLYPMIPMVAMKIQKYKYIREVTIQKKMQKCYDSGLVDVTMIVSSFSVSAFHRFLTHFSKITIMVTVVQYGKEPKVTLFVFKL